MRTTIPFSGFYESDHSWHLDHALEAFAQDPNGNDYPDAWNNEETNLYNLVSWKQAHEEYARLYADLFMEYLQAETGCKKFRWKFEELDSPREYNFTTDRILVDIPRRAVRELFKLCDKDILTKVAADRHTSRSGFISFYKPDWKTWGSVDHWDLNRLGTLIEACAQEYLSDHWEADLMDGCSGNGMFDEIVYKALTPEGKQIVEGFSARREADSDAYFKEHNVQ